MKQKIQTLDPFLAIRKELKDQGKTLVFTNGVFDILHRGHCEYLAAAREKGDALILGLNSDASVRRIKGEKKPIVPQADRAAVLSHLAMIDYIVVFEEDTPLNLIAAVLPDVLVKGADYAVEDIVGAKEVIDAGGEVVTIPLTPDRSSTNVIETIIERYCQ
ncbi:MAG: D-glycero-beta-D-manno-heptose 1-phosphate adenylyltransferase [Ectothiorhodospiraceae bacterium]|nr:D-glycero-beta-D-manno-heptose 1-phosphate adenylyltransferase [Ectothiorhodospiraceae bacterium]